MYKNSIFPYKSISTGSSFLSGYAFKSKDFSTEGIPVIKIKNIQNRRVNYLDDQFFPENLFVKKLEKFKIERNDVLIAMTGQGSVGRVGQVKEMKNSFGLLNQRVGKFICDEINLNRDFLFYVISSNTYEDFLFNKAIGSGQPNLSPSEILEVEIPFPPLSEQKAIASILSTIDDKIENNLAINKTLEDMAMALYKHWFVDFGPFQDGEFIDSELGPIPKGWEVKTFSELYEVKKGLSYKSKFYSPEGIPMVNLKCVSRNGGFRYDGIKYYAGPYKEQHIVKSGDLLVAMTDLTQDRVVLGSPLLMPDLKSNSDVIASLDIAILQQIQSDYPNLNLFFYYQMQRRDYHQYILGYGNGSTVMHLDKKGILNYQALIPSIEVLNKFYSYQEKYVQKIDKNIEVNKSLTQLRDTLLPKLISGEVRLKEFKEQVEQIV